MKEIITEIKKIWDKTNKDRTVISLNNSRETFWLIEKQLEEIKEANFSFESQKKEYTDIIIILIRWLERRNLNPKQEILQRLELRHKGKVEEITEKYETLKRRLRNERH